MKKYYPSTVMEALREKDKSIQGDTGITFEALSEYVSVLPERGMDQKSLGATITYDQEGVSITITGQWYNGNINYDRSFETCQRGGTFYNLRFCPQLDQSG